MDLHDDDLRRFESHGAVPLPVAADQGYVYNDGARIWYATYGSGFPVILFTVASATAAIGATRFQQSSAPAGAWLLSIAVATAAAHATSVPIRMS